MLDDLKLIHERDPQDALGVAERQWSQLEQDFDFDLPRQNITNIVFAGMGGSALVGLLSTTWPGYNVPFEVCRTYDIPAYVSENTLFIASSYSGNTEETLEALSQAEAKHAQIVVISGGGKLAETAAAKNYPIITLPKAEQPRYALFYFLKALVVILENAGLLAESSASQELHQAAEFLQTASQGWLPAVPTAQNPAKQLALECMGKSVVIYAGPVLAPAAYKWKISFNENAKNVAWWGTLPEFNHNEFIGWSSHPTDKPYAVIDLRSDLEHPRVQRRFDVTERLLSGMRPSPHTVQAKGTTKLEQLLWAVMYGDFVSLYVALLNGVNPAPVELVEKFKQELA